MHMQELARKRQVKNGRHSRMKHHVGRPNDKGRLPETLFLMKA